MEFPEPGLVPWYSTKEWESVSRMLYDESSGIDEFKGAVKQLEEWKIRCENPPIGIECAAVIFNAVLKDKDKVCGFVGNVEEMCVLYSASVAKFLNLIIDSSTCEHLAGATSTMYKKAIALNIPAWIVKLRHDSSHGSNSTSDIEILRAAANFCIRWLYDKYWLYESVELNDVIVDGENGPLAAAVFYMDKYCTLKYYQNEGMELFDDLIHANDNENNFAENLMLKRAYSLNKESSLKDVCKLLLQKFSKATQPEGVKRQLICILLDDNHLLQISISKENDTLLKSELEMWCNLLNVILNEETWELLLGNLLKTSQCVMEHFARRKKAVMWLRQLCRSVFRWKTLFPMKYKHTFLLEYIMEDLQKPDIEVDVDIRVQPKNVPKSLRDTMELELDFCLNFEYLRKLLQLAMSQFNEYTYIFLTDLMDVQVPPLDREQRENLLKLVTISKGEAVQVEILKKGNLILDRISVEKSYDGNTNNLNKIWTKCDENWSWKLHPVGCLPWILSSHLIKSLQK